MFHFLDSKIFLCFRKVLVFIVLVLVFNFLPATPKVLAVENKVLNNQVDKEQQLAYLYDLLEILTEILSDLKTKVRVEMDPASITRLASAKTEKSYFVAGGQLWNFEHETPRQVDQEIFTFLKEVWGEEFVREKVGEFRIFNDEVFNLSAYVEKRSDRKKFVVGVNQTDFNLEKNYIKKSFAGLFIHEYAHIVLENKAVFTENFAKRFWSEADNLQKQKVRTLTGRELSSSLEKYFSKNKSRFVSPYATLSPDEDLAETFKEFIFSAPSNNTSVANAKIKYFSEDKEMVKVRLELRERLKELGVL